MSYRENAIAKPRTVFGVPLEEDERVLYFHRPRRSVVVILRVLFGLMFLPVLPLSIWMFWAAATDRSYGVYAQVITSGRLLAITGRGTVKWEVRWEQLVSVELFRGARALEVRTKGSLPVYLEDDGRPFAAKLKELEDVEVRLGAPAVDYVDQPPVRRRR